MSASNPISALVSGYAAKLKFPRLLLVTIALFMADLVIPDLVPFIDEILLALGVALLGSWRDKKGEKRLEDGQGGRGVRKPEDGDMG